MKKINTDLKYLIGLWIVLALAIIATFAHHGNLIIDNGREAYYPTQVLLGKVLYKDIFNIYGPFAYMFNAALFKFFGTNLNVLYTAGSICGFAIISLIYGIARKFLNYFLSFSIALFTISIGILNTNLFNFIFPYSYAMLYGFVACLASVWLLLKYQENSKKTSYKTHYLYLSCFFAGLCVVSKYEFLPYLIVIIYAMAKIKPLKPKEYYYTIFSLLFMPIFCFGILFLQGLRISDLIYTLHILKKMTQCQTLKYFYHTQGVYFEGRTIPLLATNFIKTSIPLAFLFFGRNFKNKFLSNSLIILGLILAAFLTTPSSFVFLPVLIILFAIYDFKNIKANIPLTILVLSAILISLKVLWGLATLNYGVFFVSLLLVTFIALILNRFKNNNINQNSIGVYLLIVGIILASQNLSAFKEKNLPVRTQNGKIFTTKYFAQPTNELIDYINKNTKKTDKIVILPEGSMINFLTNRPSDNYYTSLIPLYIETFGEEKIISHFEKTKPEYIIFNNWNSQDYYFKYICHDYAASFCAFVEKNYTQNKLINDDFTYMIFKKR